MSGLLFRPLRQIADRFNTLQMGMVSSERIFKILEDDSEINDNGIIEQSSFNGLIEFKNVKFSYIENQLVINDISFKIAAANAFKEAFLNANPRLLEPTKEISIKVPEQMMGNVMTELQSRRSMILGIETQDNYQILKCITPAVELFGFSTVLRSITQGKATFSTVFSSYQTVPANVQKELVVQSV